MQRDPVSGTSPARSHPSATRRACRASSA
jgi:hypothetical protein